ncbi:hypothetical protein [Streptomyces sp. C10-9-1]|uniref:hypothetical protein n=1 Tax=Streptomyces sp. C10-9-1 TaxID=1859285 RepID=UPI003D709244
MTFRRLRLRTRLQGPAPTAPVPQAPEPDPTAPGPDELRLRHHLRRALDGPPAPPPPEQTTVTVTVPRDPYWLDQILATTKPAARPADSAHGPSGAEPDRSPDPSGPQPASPQAGERSPWWRLPAAFSPPQTTAPAPDQVPAEPGVHVTIVAPATPPRPTRRDRIRWWTLRRGTAAGVGYLIGLGPAIGHRLDEAGPGAIGFAVLLWLVAWYAATKAALFVPRQASPEAHTAADWALHIPSATVLLALALHTPGATL